MAKRKSLRGNSGKKINWTNIILFVLLVLAILFLYKGFVYKSPSKMSQLEDIDWVFICNDYNKCIEAVGDEDYCYALYPCSKEDSEKTKEFISEILKINKEINELREKYPPQVD